jgi:hypothetical protein
MGKLYREALPADLKLESASHPLLYVRLHHENAFNLVMHAKREKKILLQVVVSLDGR